MNFYYQNYTRSLAACLQALEAVDGAGNALEAEVAFDALCQMSTELQDQGKKQCFTGNGASAAFANHMALDWSKNGRVPSHSFSDSATLTALGNDLSYEDAFATALGWYFGKGDLLVTISSSGNSPNIVKTIAKARELGMKVVTLSGLKPDNQSRRLGDLNLYIPAKTYGMVECAHQVLLHVWLDRFMGVREWERDGFQNMNRDEFSL